MAKIQVKKPGNKFFSRINYQFQRGIRELLSDKELSKDAWVKIKQFFDDKCAFCGIQDNKNPRAGLIPDHLIPTTENGEMCLGNIVPACHGCTDKRGSKYWKYFLQQNSNTAESKIKKIEDYLSTYPRGLGPLSSSNRRYIH